MICSDTWHKYREWYFKIVIETILEYHEWFYAKYHKQIMLLFIYITTRKRFANFHT